jgi:DNA repair exonuclease SbcCD ATPase subunit
MRELVKNKRKLIIEEIRTFADEIRTLEESIESVLEKIEQYKAANKKKDASKIDQLKKRLIELNEGRKKLKDANEKTKTKINDCDTEYRQKSSKQSQLQSEINSINKGLKLYENNNCPTCSAPLDSDFHKDIKKEKEDSLKVLTEEFENIEKEVLKIDENLISLRDQGRKIHVKVGELENKMTGLKDELISLAEKTTDESSSHLKDLIKEFKSKKSKKDKDKLKSEGEDYYLTILENLMGEDGIKNLAIRSILPSFNNHILIMGKEMGIPFGIRFDDKFNCTLLHLGQEVSPKTLSTGERKKVDFVIIMALMKMIKVRFPSLNILFLDEIFSSIDADGVYHIINILHNTIEEIGLNTFVINHTVLPSEYFDKKLEITKGAGFSEFTIETIG